MVLEEELHVYDKWMVHFRQDLLLIERVFDLIIINQVVFTHYFDSLVTVRLLVEDQVNFSLLSLAK